MAGKLPEDEARQGRTGTRVLFILIAALVLSVVFWGGAEIYGMLIEPQNPVGEEPGEHLDDDTGG